MTHKVRQTSVPCIAVKDRASVSPVQRSGWMQKTPTILLQSGGGGCLCSSVSTWSSSRLECPAMKNSPFHPLFLFFFFSPEHVEGSSDHNTWSPAGLVRIHYRLQLQHGLECEESFWAGVLVQGSKPHIATFSLRSGENRIGSDPIVAQVSPRPGERGGFKE